MNEPVRIGVIGLGAQGKQHLSSLPRVGAARLGAVVDLDAALVSRVAEAHAVRGFSDPEAFFRAGTEMADALIVCVPNKLHCETVLRALSAGMHVLVEKPMALSLAECDRMIAAAEAADLRLMVSHNLLFYEPHRVVRDLIASGAIRRPHLYRTRLTCGNMYGGWRDHADLCGGGLLIDSGAHRFYTARQLMGEVRSVTAWLDTDDPRRRGEETGCVVMEFEEGGMGVIDATFHAPGETFDDLVELVSRDAMIWIPGSEAEYLKSWSHPPVASGAHVMINRTGAKWEVVETPPDDWAASCMKSVAHFVECVLGRAEPITSGHEGRRNLAVLVAAYLSGMERRSVPLDEVG